MTVTSFGIARAPGSERRQRRMAYTPLRTHSHSYSYPTNPNRSTFTFRLDDENAPPDPTMGADAIIPGGARYHFFRPLYSTYSQHRYHRFLLLQAKQCARPSPFSLSNKKKALNQPTTFFFSSHRQPRLSPPPAPRLPSLPSRSPPRPCGVPSSNSQPPFLAGSALEKSGSVSILTCSPLSIQRTTSCTSFGQAGYHRLRTWVST